MAHECDDCGESFETLTRLRLHDCGDVQSDTFSTSTDSGRSKSDSSPSQKRNKEVAELDNLLDRFSDGDVDALHYAVVEFEAALSTVVEEDSSGDTFRTCSGHTTSASATNSTMQRKYTVGHSLRM